TRDAITNKLKTMSDPGNRQGMSIASTGDRMTVLLFPVRDPEAFAARIDFGRVRGVEGHVITVVARKVDQPPPAPRIAGPGDAKDANLEGKVYLSALPEIDPGPFPAPFWHFGKNGDVGNGSKIKVDGRESPNALGMHPPGDGKACRVQYQLDGKAE